jgi:diguanylate cyclase (GGDEF)-like protein
VVTEPEAGWLELGELFELTERALTVGLDEALEDARRRLTERLGATVDDPAVQRAIARAAASAERVLAARDANEADVDELRSMARVDELTGVLNRRAFFERLEEDLVRARRTNAPLTLVLCDVDRLKAINDAHGHPAGDRALRAIADLLNSNVRASDSVGRIGGDEFAVSLPGAEEADAMLHRLCEEPPEVEPEVEGLRASFGTAHAPEDGVTRDALIAAADRRLYEQKATRREDADS